MRQSIELIAKFPTIIAYAYNIYRHSVQGTKIMLMLSICPNHNALQWDGLVCYYSIE